MRDKIKRVTIYLIKILLSAVLTGVVVFSFVEIGVGNRPCKKDVPLLEQKVTIHAR